MLKKHSSKSILHSVWQNLWYKLRSEEQWIVERQRLESRHMSAALNKGEFKDLGPSHKSLYYFFYSSCTCAHIQTHTHTLPLQAGVSLSAGKAKSSLLILSCCQSALFRLNEKPSLATPKTWPRTGVCCWSDQIRSEPLCSPPSCFTTNTVGLFSLCYHAYQPQ